MADLLIQYSTSTAFASAVIRRLTHSCFSHVEFVLREPVWYKGKTYGPGLLGVSGPGKYPTYDDPGGVQVRPFNPWPYLNEPIRAHLKCSPEIVGQIIAFGLSQLNKPFDKHALWAFLKDRAGVPIEYRDWRDPSSWFCSEYVTRCAEVGGLFQYRIAVTSNLVSPNDTLLLFNPFMTIDSVEQFLGMCNTKTILAET